MRRKVWLLLVSGLVLSGLASVGVYLYLTALENDLRAAKSQIERMSSVSRVPVLTRDIARGEPITSEDFELADITASALPDGVMHDPAETLPQGSTPLLALDDLQAGQFLMKSQLATPGKERASAGFMLPLGQSAFAFSPENLDDYAANLSPGESVDVYWRARDRGGRTVTRLLAEGLERARPVPAAPAAETANTGVLAPRSNPVSAARTASNIVLTGPAEAIADLIHAEGRGELFIVPSNPAIAANESPNPTTDQKLAQLPETALPSQDTSSTTAKPTLAERIRLAAAGEQPAGSPTGETTGAGNNSGITALFPQNNSPSKCVLTVVRGASRTAIEVPCQ